VFVGIVQHTENVHPCAASGYTGTAQLGVVAPIGGVELECRPLHLRIPAARFQLIARYSRISGCCSTGWRLIASPHLSRGISRSISTAFHPQSGRIFSPTHGGNS